MRRDLQVPKPSRLWRGLPEPERLKAAEAFWTDEDSAAHHAEAIHAIAEHRRLRPRSAMALSLDRKVRYLAGLPQPGESLASRLLVTYHFAERRPLLSHFLDRLGIPHEEGLIAADEVAAPSGEALRAAAADLRGAFPAADVRFYFLTLLSQDPDTWHGLADLPDVLEDHSG